MKFVLVGGMWLAAMIPAAASAQDYAGYARYQTPGQCLQLVNRLDRLYWRDKRRDTVAYAPERDSVVESAAQAGRACGARFSVADTDTRDLLDLATLDLLVHRDADAYAAFGRLMQTKADSPAVVRAWTLYQWMTSLIRSRPLKLQYARNVAAQIEALGPEAATWRQAAHRDLAQYAMMIYDPALAKSEAEAAVQAGSEMNKFDRVDAPQDLIEAYAALAEAVNILQGAPQAVAVFEKALADVLPLRLPESPEQGMLAGMVRASQQAYKQIGTPAPPLSGQFWFNRCNVL